MQAGTLPIPEDIEIIGHKQSRWKIFEQLRPELTDNELYRDKSYQLPNAKEVKEIQYFSVLTPKKKQKGQKI